MADKVRKIQSKLMTFLQGSEKQLLAVVAYVPIVGWVYPYFFRKEDALYRFHGEQAMHLNLVGVALYFTIWLLEHFPITSFLFGAGHVLHPISRTLWLLCMFAYLSFSIIGAYQAFCGNTWEIPYLKAMVAKVISYIKSLKPGA